MAKPRFKGLTFLYALAVGGAVAWLLAPFAPTWIRQAEVQCFIPEWMTIRETLTQPGGAQTVVGQACVALMQHPWQAVCLHVLWLLGVTLLNLAILQKISRRSHNHWLALIPAIALAGAHLSPFYVMDGTVGWVLLLLAAWGYVSLSHPLARWIYAPLSTFLVFGATGQMVALYGVLLLLLHYLANPKKSLPAWTACLLSLLLTAACIRLAWGVPLTDGIYSERYQQAQLQPDSYLYYIALRAAAVFALVWLAAALLRRLSEDRPVVVCTHALLIGAVCGTAWLNRPDNDALLTNRMNQLAVVEQSGDWEKLRDVVCEQPIHDYISLNYLSLSLAERGVLADSLFHYDPNGPQSLLAQWDRSYYTSVLLSDLHFLIGDLSISESYAMEGLTLAKRGGSPRMLRRMETLSLLRGEEKLAQKYTRLLNRLVAAPAELPEQAVPYAAHEAEKSDALQGQFSIDSLWMQRLEAGDAHPMLWQYAGCSFLLSKELDSFRRFLTLWQERTDEPLPIHFREAAQILALEQPDSCNVTFTDEQAKRFLHFRTDVLNSKQNAVALLDLRQQYGHTYWFYYYCKKIAL